MSGNQTETTATALGQVSSSIPITSTVNLTRRPEISATTLRFNQLRISLQFAAIQPPKEARLSPRGSPLKDMRLQVWQRGFQAGVAEALRILEEVENNGTTK